MAEWNNFLGFPIRRPSQDEEEFFRGRSDVNDLPNFVGAYAADDNSIVLNPFVEMDPGMKRGLLMNEATRLHLRETEAGELPFSLTPKQEEMFGGFPVGEKTLMDMQHSLIGRILSGDPNLPEVTSEQNMFAEEVFQQLVKRFKQYQKMWEK